MVARTFSAEVFGPPRRAGTPGPPMSLLRLAQVDPKAGGFPPISKECLKGRLLLLLMFDLQERSSSTENRPPRDGLGWSRTP